MKILRFNDDRIGILQGENKVVDVSDFISHRVEKGAENVIEEIIGDFTKYQSKFAESLDSKAGVPVSDVKLLPPIPRPSKCLAAFSNYMDRPDRKLDQMHLDFFYKCAELTGPEGTVDLPDIPNVVVYQAEAELAFVMRKTPRNVSEVTALDSVFGYVPFFDISARGLTRRTQFVPKGAATFSPCGPWIATKDEISDPHNLTVKSWINGNRAQDFSTKHMAHKIPAQIAWLSKLVELQAGDIIATGTHHEGLRAINDGDLLEVEIEKIGKARFNVKGQGPRKDIDFIPGKTPVPQFPGKITPV